MTKHAKLLFPHGLGRLFPLQFRMRFWLWKSGRAWLMSSFYQKHWEFISGITSVRGKEDLLSFWPRAQRNGTPQLKPQEAYKTLLIFLHRNSSLPTRLAARKFLRTPSEWGSYFFHAGPADGKFSQSDARKAIPAERTSARLQVHLPS